MGTSSKAKAFTLVELLVVVAIIALLISALVPSLSAAKDYARTVYCLNNLRQMAVAAQSYTLANEGSYPYHLYRDTKAGVLYGWDFTIRRVDGRPVHEPGLIWQGQALLKIQQCPSFAGSDNWQDDPFTGYNYNTSYIGSYEGPRDNPVRPARAGDVKTPGLCALFGDGQYAGGANKFMRSPRRGRDASFSGREGGTQGFRHGGGTNVAFCDGHALTHYQRHTAGNAKVAEGTGFLGPDNRLYDLE